MDQKTIREYNNQIFTAQEAAQWLKELDDRTRSDVEGFNSIDEIANATFRVLPLADKSTVETNVRDIGIGEMQTLDKFFTIDKPVITKEGRINTAIAFDKDIHFRDNIYSSGYDYNFDEEGDLSGTTPTEPATGYVDEFDPSTGGSAYVFFDHEGSGQWELTYTGVPYASYANWLSTTFPMLLGNYTFPKGLVVRVNNGSDISYAFLNDAKTAMSELVPEDQILSDTSVLRKYYVNDTVIGYTEVLFASDAVPEISSYLVPNTMTVNKKFISESDIRNVYAEYGSGFSAGYYVKQRINAVDAEFNNGWLKVYNPVTATFLDNYTYKNGKAKLPAGFGDIFTKIVLNVIDKEAEADTLEDNVIMVRDKNGYISPVFDVTYYEIEYEMEYTGYENGLILRNHTSYLTQTGDNILISDDDNTHSDAMADWVVGYHPDFTGQVFETDDEPAGDFRVTSEFGATYAKEKGCNIIVEAYSTTHNKANIVDSDLLFVSAHYSNSTVRHDVTEGPEEFYNNIVIVGSGLESDADVNWTTSYGYGIEFIEPTRIADAPAGVDTSALHATEHQQSPATAFVASKLKAIKDVTRVSWAIVRRAARQTASLAGNWDMYRGYGVIDVTAAIAWINTNFPDIDKYLADRYAGMFGQSDRLTYSDIHDNAPLPKRLTVGENSGSNNPTTSDIPDGKSVVWKNTTNGEVRIWRNDGGAMIASATFTAIP